MASLPAREIRRTPQAVLCLGSDGQIVCVSKEPIEGGGAQVSACWLAAEFILIKFDIWRPLSPKATLSR